MGTLTGASIRTAQGPRPLPLTLQRAAQIPSAATALTRRPSSFAPHQRRTLFSGGRRRDPDWQRHAEPHFKISTEKINRMVYRHARGMRRKPVWGPDARRNDEIWGWQLGRHNSSKNLNEDQSPFWGWDQTSWGKEHSVERDKMEREFAQLKRAVEADPYGVLFGRRLQPFPFGKEGSFSSLCRSLFGFNDSESRSEMEGSKGQANFKDVHHTDIGREKQKVTSSNAEIMYEFDPISGRMAPNKASSTLSNPQRTHDDRVVDIPVGKYKIHDEKLGSRNHTTPTRKGPEERLPPRNQPPPKPNVKHTSSSNLDTTGSRNANKPSSTDQPQRDPNSSGKNKGATTHTSHRKVDEIHSSKEYPVPEDHKQAAGSPPRHISPQAIFLKYKDYVASKPKLESNGSQPGDRPNLIKSNKDANPIPGSDQPSKKIYPYPDGEKEDLSSLRARDVRKSFEHRIPKPVSENKIAGPPKPESSVQKPGEISRGKTEGKIGQPISRGASATKDEPIKPVVKTRAEKPEELSNNTKKNKTSSTKQNPLPVSKATADSTTVSDKYKIQEIVDDVENLNRSASTLIAEFREAIQQNVILNAWGPTPTAAVNSEGSIASEHATQYRILAYDPSSRRVRDAAITSASVSDFSSLHPVEAVAKLSHPTLFLDFFPRLEAEGYELFSAGTEVLIFKKSRRTGDPLDSSKELVDSVSKQSLHSPSQAAQLEQESIDQIESSSSSSSSKPKAPSTTSPNKPAPSPDPTVTTGFPTGGKTHDPLSPPPEKPTSSTSSSKKENRSIWGSIRNTVRRVFLAGVATGGTFYAMGVVAEYFRTGGRDGLGPRGFTGLEGRDE